MSDARDDISRLEYILTRNAAKVAQGIIFCDFCSAEGAPYCAGCPPFEVSTTDDIPGTSNSDWAMCTDCAVLVYARDQKAVLERSVGAMSARHPGISKEQMRPQINELHQPFWRLFTGKIYDVTDEEKRNIQRENAESHKDNLAFIQRLKEKQGQRE